MYKIPFKNGQIKEFETLHNADLRGADLQGKDLRNVNLHYANLRSADLRSADLTNADLSHTDLRGTYLRGANLEGADLRCADLTMADLRGANLRGANLDYSSGIPFWCGAFDVKVDKKIAVQMLYHLCRLDCDDADVKKVLSLKSVKKLANQFHLVNECGEIK
jgi:hypothetical protein